MVSFAVQHAARTAARILLLAAAATPYAAFSQGEFEPIASNEQQRSIVERILEEQAHDGPYSAELIGPLTALSLLYQEGGDHALATAAVDRALQVVRANYGLFTLEQAPLIEQSIRNEESRGNVAAAWELEQELLTLAKRHPDDLRTVPIFHAIADKRMNVLQRYLSGEFPQELVIGCFYYSDIGSCTSGSRGVAAHAILADAWRNYADAIRVLLRHRQYSSDELQQMEMELVRSSYLYGSPDVGRQSLRRLVAYEAANADPWFERVDALLCMTDWDLLSGRNGFALDTYTEAYELLKEKGVAPASIDQLFSPPVPIVLPTFLPNPLVSEETPESTGYVDVAFEISKYGRGREVRILDTTTNASDEAKDHVANLVWRSRFRPRMTDGRVVDDARIVVRYYVNETHTFPAPSKQYWGWGKGKTLSP